MGVLLQVGKLYSEREAIPITAVKDLSTTPIFASESHVPNVIPISALSRKAPETN